MLANYKMAIIIICGGANNFKQCITECTQKNRLNHILAYLRLCQAAYEDDQTAVDILLERDEGRIADHPRYPSLMDFNQILFPLIDNGTLTITEPLHVALRAKHLATARKILLCSSQLPRSGMIDWHGLRLTNLDGSWLRKEDYSNLQLLCLSFNSLKQIPVQVANFESLVKLQVAFNNLTYIPSSLFHMPCIQNMDFSYNSISALPEALLGKITMSLNVLTISNNLLRKFPDYFIESAITILDLSKNRFKEVPASVCSMKQLESLSMSHNTEIQFIPYQLGGLKNLKTTAFDGLPYTFNIPNDSLMNFIKNRFKSMQTVSHYEIVVIGSLLYVELLDRVQEILVNSTSDYSVLRFSSPTHFLNLHHVFEIPNAVYLVLWDCQNKQDPNDFHRVLRHLNIHVPDSPIVVAACWNVFDTQLKMETERLIALSTWKDLREKVHLEHVILEEVDERSLSSQKDFPQYSPQGLVESISTLSQRIVVTQFIPWSYYKFGLILAQKQDIYLQEKRSPMLSEDDFCETVCNIPSSDLTGPEEIPELLTYLNLRALVLRIPGPSGSQNYFIFNRQWFCDVLSNVLSRQGVQVIRSFSGVVHQEGLIDLLGCSSLQLPLPSALQNMLNRWAVALALSSEKWLIPSMLMKSQDSTANIEADQYGIRRQYTLNLTPPTFWCRLIAHLLIHMENFVREMSDANFSSSDASSPYATLPRQGVVDWSYWSKGIICWQNACHLVYSIESINACFNPYCESIEIRVPSTPTGYRTMHRLSLIIDTLLKNWYPKVWSSVEIWVPCSYCIHTGIPNVPSISFHDCLLALSKGVGVKCLQHPDKIVSINKIIPDLIHEDVSRDVYVPSGSVDFNISDKSSCLSPPPTESVFKGTYNHHLVAVKPFPHKILHGISDDRRPRNQSSPPLLQMWSEFEILRHLMHCKCPFIIDIVGLCPDPLCLMFPFARWSSLEDVFQAKDISIPHLVAMKMIYQLANALSVLQVYNIIHRNISLNNLLVFSLNADDEVNIKLSGFSNSCYSIGQGVCVGQCGTFPAPEMLLSNEGEYDERVDVFAFAFVAHEIVTQSIIRLSSNISLREQSTVSRPSLEPVRIRAPYLVPLITKCWHPDRTKRPFAATVLKDLKDPLNTIVQDGYLVNKEHEFFAATATFTRTQNDFHPHIFISSGQLIGERDVHLTRDSLPGLNFEVFKKLPIEFVICMGCVGSQLWVSFYGKKLRVYSASSLDFISEFTFNHHVLVISVTPTSVYLGLENGVLQVYDVAESTPTDPILTKIINPGEEFKCLEALEDSIICATKCTIFCLHPDTLKIEQKCDLDPEKEIRCIVVSRCYRSPEEDELEGNDLMWVAFRRWEKMVVMNPWTGKCYYNIDCSTVVDRPPSKVYVQSLRVVLDTIWVGLNTGHILMFASRHKEPRLLTHLKIHQRDVRQLLLLHPSYMGPTTVLSSSEIDQSLRSPKRSLMTDQKPTFPESVLVVSFGTGIESTLCSVDSHGKAMEDPDETACSDGLYAVVLEGTNIYRTMKLEERAEREPLPYMGNFSETDNEDHLYAIPPDGIYAVPRRMTALSPSTNIPRVDTWSAKNLTSPVYSNFQHKNQYNTVPPHEIDYSLSVSISGPPDGPPPPSDPTPPNNQLPPPRVPPPLPPQDNLREDSSNYPIIHVSNASSQMSKPEGGGGGGDSEEDDDDPYQYYSEYLHQDHFTRAQTYTLPILGSSNKSPSLQERRFSNYEGTSRPEIEDSADDCDPYVRMDTFFGSNPPASNNLRLTANRAKKKAEAKRLHRLQSGLSELPEEILESREDYLAERTERELDLKPAPKVKPKPKPLKRPPHLM